MSPPSPEPAPIAAGQMPGWLPDKRLTGLLAELRQRWEAGDRVSVEAFLKEQSVPQVGDEALLDLLYQEILLREHRGEHPGLEEYVARFPFLADALRKQFTLHRAMASGSLLSDLAEPGPTADANRGDIGGESQLTRKPLLDADGEQRTPVDSHPTVAYPAPGSIRPQDDASPHTEWQTQAVSASAPIRPHEGVRVPGYVLEGELGRGSMGVVYRAWHVALKRTVALKMITPSGQDVLTLRNRFRREGEAVASLQHPHVVQIFEVGEVEGSPFFSMEFCPGGSLAVRLAATPQPAGWSAGLVALLARAVHHAHGRGIIHRDLKPGNVLLAEDGTPKVSDFGLARKLDETTLTGSWEVMGTPCYMAPEQARLTADAVGPPADIYALGAILYACLTGRPPFKAVTALETIRQLVDQEPVPPSRLVPGLPRDLETVCLKCLHKAPGRRYPGAGELADDLDRFVAGRPVLARPIGSLEKVVRWTRRQPLAAVLLALVFLSVSGGLTGITLAWRQALEEADGRQKAYVAEIVQREKVEQQLYFSRVALADREIRSGKPAWARHWLDLCPDDFKGWEWGYLNRLARGGAELTWPGHERPISCLAIHPQGTILASSSGDGTIGLWKIDTGKLLHRLEGHDNSVNWVHFAPDGMHLASAGADGAIILWNVATGKAVKRLGGHEQSVSAVAYHPEGGLLASATFDPDRRGEVWLWDIEKGEAVRKFHGHQSRVTGLAFSPDGKLLASSGHDGTVRLLDGRTAEQRLAFRGHAFPVSAVVFSPDGLLAASAAGRLEADRPDQGEVLIWGVTTGEVVHRLQGHSRRPTTLAFSPDGNRLATAGWDGEVKLWDVSTGQEVLTLQGHRDGVLALAFSPDGFRIASGGMDRSIRLWLGWKGEAR